MRAMRLAEQREVRAGICFDFGTGRLVPTLSKLQQNRRVVQDFTLNTLAGINGPFARLVYVASLRDLSSGGYEHQGLAVLYPEEAVQQALELCHEQIFERILEMPLEKQLEDLRDCLAAMDGGLASVVSHWRQLERSEERRVGKECRSRWSPYH